MISIHTFEFRMGLSKKEHIQIKKKFCISNKRQSWTEHRYSDKGIQIILYKGKTKGFIYLKYIVNLKRIFNKDDYLHLLEPTSENITYIWETIRNTWDEIGCGIPFEKFILTRLDFTCDIQMENTELVQEYIRLLNKSILHSIQDKFSVDGIYHNQQISEDMRKELQQNCCKYKITECENFQFYNKIYELENENLPIPQKEKESLFKILRIELQIHRAKRISEFLQNAGLYNAPIEEQFRFFITNAPIILIGRLEKIYSHGNYHQKSYIIQYVKNDTSIKNKTKKNILQFLYDCNRNTNLGRLLELDKQYGEPNKRKKSLKYLSSRSINPVTINSKLHGYEILPDIFHLIEEEIKNQWFKI